MYALQTLCVATVLVSVTGGDGWSGEAVTGRTQITSETVSAMAETFVTRHHDSGSAGKPRLSFQDAEVHRQDVPGKWAVLGGYMAFAAGKDPSPHAFGLTMQLTCPHPDKPECWRLEKLLIDKQLIVDK